MYAFAAVIGLLTISLAAAQPAPDFRKPPTAEWPLVPGFIVVLEQIPANAKFDKEAREQLLDIFRDASDYWGDRKIPFRCFYSFL
jgi:hypothetical protein